MASLQELLAEEGFKRTKPKQGFGGSAASRASSLPTYSAHNRLNSVEYRARRNRSRSDAFSRRSASVLSSVSGRDRGEDLRRSVLRRSSVDGYRRDSPEIRGFDIETYNESQETEEEFNERYHVSYPDSNEELEQDAALQKQENLYSERFQQKDSYKMRNSNELYEEEKVERVIGNVENTLVSELKLDELTVKAIVSILTGYLRRFFKDETFRASFYRSCTSCLGITRENENDHRKDGVINNLKQAIKVIERTVSLSPSPQELKRAALQLSVITGLSSKELKDDFTGGIPNLNLAACAHLYLSVIYKFQKKDKASAKHLLQVFCDCPNQARNTLLPGLWDRLFLPHLSHLREWYDNEVELIARTSSRLRKLKLLEDAYSKILDVGTNQIGVYYKEWLVEEAEGPELPSIVAPQISFMEMPIEVSRSRGSDEFPSPGSSASSQAMVSKKLYDSVFRQSKKIEVDNRMEEEGVEEETEEEEKNVSRSRTESLRQEDHNAISGDDIPASDVSSRVPLLILYLITIDSCFKIYVTVIWRAIHFELIMILVNFVKLMQDCSANTRDSM